MTAIVEVLSVVEAHSLRKLEESIESGLYEARRALQAIRDERLYRGTHSTFESYCCERWGMTRRHVNRQIMAVEVVAALGPIGPTPSEAVARELAPLRSAPDQLREAWAAAVEQHGEKPTANQVREVVEEQRMEVAAPTKREQMRANAHKRRVVDTVSYLRGLATGLGDLDVPRAVAAMEPGEAVAWAKDIEVAISTLRRLRANLLKEST